MSAQGLIYQAGARYRAKLLAGHRGTVRDVAGAYGVAWRGIVAEKDRLERGVPRAERTPAWWVERGRLDSVARETAAQVERVARLASSKTIGEQVRAAALGDEAVEVMARYVAPEHLRVSPVGRFTALAGFVADGTPLAQHFAQLGPMAAREVTNALLVGASLGERADQVAARMRGALGGNMARALTIARTELMRSYREAQHQRLLTNPRAFRGWVWWSRLARNTCPACFALHGKLFPARERMGSHPNCACTMMPLVHGTALPRSGAERFATMHVDDRRAILGPTRFAAYEAGALDLEELVERTRDPVWGAGVRVRPLAELFGEEGARAWRARASA